MITKLAIVTLLLALLCFMMVETTLAQPQMVSPGVSKGNTFTYDVKGFWSSNDPNATISEDILQKNMTDYFKVEITDVSGTEVTMHTVWRFTNGTQLDGGTKIDIQTGIYNGTASFWAIYGGNLNVGDRIRPMGIDQLTVNASQTKTYANTQREINRFTVIGQFESNDSSRTFNDNMVVQFDKQTGMLVELHDEQIYTNPAYTQTISWKITDTNAFNAPEFPMTTLVLAVSISVIIVIAILVAVVTYKKRGKKRKRRFQQT